MTPLKKDHYRSGRAVARKAHCRQQLHVGLVIGIVAMLIGCTSSTSSPGATAAVSPDAERTPVEQAATPNSQVRLSSSDCTDFSITVSKVDCYRADVPERWDEPDGPRLSLALAVVRAENPDTGNPPLVWLSGGPGDPTVKPIADALMGIAAPLRADRDVILLDGRGTGLSRNYEECRIDELGECAIRLTSDGIDLAALNTSETARDFAMIPPALGYSEWDLYGISFGTRTALTIMSHHPEGIRAAVLDSSYPQHVAGFRDGADSVVEAFNDMAVGCETDELCANNYPGLRADIERLLEAATPGQAGALIDLIASDSRNPAFPGVITFAASSDQAQTDLLSFATSAVRSPGTADTAPPQNLATSQGVALAISVFCTDEVDDSIRPSSHESTYGANADAHFATSIERRIAPIDLEDLPMLCEQWGIRSQAGSWDAVRTYDQATLILSGTSDTESAVSWAQQLAVDAGNSQLLLAAGSGHSVIQSRGCAIDLIVSFLDNPDANVDGDCLSPAVSYVADPAMAFSLLVTTESGPSVDEIAAMLACLADRGLDITGIDPASAMVADVVQQRFLPNHMADLVACDSQ